jgi:SpoVK/Ycf46/Vps4 family AAA+-type ATPase
MSIATKSTRTSPFKRIRAYSDIERAARQIAGTMFAGLGRSQLESLLKRDGDEVLAALGLHCDDDPEVLETRNGRVNPQIYAAISGEAKRLADGPVVAVQPLDRNLNMLVQALDLDWLERAVLRAGALCVLHPPLKESLGAGRSFSRFQHDKMRALFKLGLVELRVLLSPRSRLVQLGFLTPDDFCPLDTDEAFARALCEPAFEPTQLLAHKLKRSAPARLGDADFAHLPDLSRLARHIERAVGGGLPGVNVLVYGPPGTGKTELVRSLAAGVGAQLWEVPASDEDGEMWEGYRRAAAYVLTQKLLKSDERNLLLFDEIEDLFGSGRMDLDLFGSRRNRLRSVGKGWVNEMLESNPVPTLWLCNDISALDPAYLRRFDEVIELRPPTRSIRRRIVERYLPASMVSEACQTRIAEIDGLPPAQVERVGKVLASMTDATLEERDRAALRMLENSLRAMGVIHRLPQPELPAHYDPGVLNADFDLNALVEMLGVDQGGRALLYGPPGTGKSAFAHHAGKVLERPVLVRRASDLLDRYLGGTEQNIAAAFREAEAEGAILLIDEADSLLRERQGAHRSWEVTQVNEMLTQMESFNGVFIASTNLVDGLDAASLRRFDFKVKFNYLREAQRLAMFERLCGDLCVQPQCGDLRLIAGCDWLTPGDFAVIRRQSERSRSAPLPSELARRLLGEVAMKRDRPSGRIGFAL